jgi:hypothetical protein
MPPLTGGHLACSSMLRIAEYEHEIILLAEAQRSAQITRISRCAWRS